MTHKDKDITSKKRPTRTTIVRVLTAIAVVLAVILLLDRIAPHLPAAENWIRDQGAWAPIFYVLMVILLTLICFPMDVLFIAAGMIFGLWWGTLYLFIATMLSQAIVFTVSRYLLRNKVEAWLAHKPKMRILNRAIEIRGAQLLFLIRMAPIPASPVTYLMGVSSMSFGKFMLATTGLLPVAFASMYLGYAAVHWASTANDRKHHFGMQDIELYIGLVVTIVGVAYIGHTARKALQQAERELTAADKEFAEEEALAEASTKD